MNTSEKVYQLALHLITGIGFQLWSQLIKKFGSAQALYEASRETLQTNLKKLPPTLLKAIIEKETLPKAEALLKNHEQRKIQSLSYFDDTYPARLKHIDNPPSFLYFQGTCSLAMPRVVSLVGTRKASTYGKRTVEKILETLTAYHVPIVSGLAYGIDIHAHTTALHMGLPTVGVLASGLDIIYPAAHQKTAQAMLEHGGLVSEIPIGTTLENFQFPNRNRIIAGLSDVTIIAEAPIKSGAMITAKFANTYNREVVAVPGNIDEETAAGCNYLIKTQQAHLLAQPEDIACLMNWDNVHPTRPPTIDFKKQLPELSPEELSLVQTLQNFNKEVHIDQLRQQASCLSNNLAALLLQLELKNVLKSLPGSKFKLTKT
jgi:DNA processing protein